jgi:hypothetical protein
MVNSAVADIDYVRKGEIISLEYLAHRICPADPTGEGLRRAQDVFDHAVRSGIGQITQQHSGKPTTYLYRAKLTLERDRIDAEKQRAFSKRKTKTTKQIAVEEIFSGKDELDAE